MKRHLAAAIAFAAMTSLASAQQVSVPGRTYTFTVTPDEANTTLNKLGELPWKDVNPLIQKLIAQLNAQNAPVLATPPPSPSQTPVAPAAPTE